MRAYSMDLRERALLDSDAGMKAADVAEKYRVSGSWVRLLKQRRRETGEVAPRVQRHGRRRMLEPHLHTLAALIAAQPDRTLAELKDGLGTPASLATIWRAVQGLGVTVKKKRYAASLANCEQSASDRYETPPPESSGSSGTDPATGGPGRVRDHFETRGHRLGFRA